MLKFLSKKQVREMVSLSLAHIARLEAAGKFPHRVRLTDHPRGRCGYVFEEVTDWMLERIKKRTP